MSNQIIIKKKKSWLATLAKITFFLAAFALVIITVLANMGGNSDTLKDALEGVISQSTGHKASIGKFNNMSFFPDMGVSFEDLELSSTKDGFPVATAAKGELYFAFTDVMLGTGKIKVFNVQNFQALPGAFIKKSIQARYLEIVDVEDNRAEFIGEGSIGEDDFKIRADLQREDHKYSFANRRALELTIGPVGINGVLEDVSRTDVTLKDLKIMLSGEDVLSGEISAVSDEVRIKLTGDLHFAQHGTKLQSDLSFNVKSERPRIRGRLISPEFHIDDFENDSRLVSFIDECKRIFNLSPEKSAVDLSFGYIDAEARFEQYWQDGKSLGALNFPVHLENSKLRIGESGADITGDNLDLETLVEALKALKASGQP